MDSINKIFNYLLVLYIFFLCPVVAFSFSVYTNFDNFPGTGRNSIPKGGDGWVYSSWKSNNGDSFNGSCGFINTNKYSNSNLFDSFSLYKNSYNTPNMGYNAFAFMDIDNTMGVTGNSLRVTITGGSNSTGTFGLPLQTKEEYLNYINNSINPVVSSKIVGYPTIYFMNSGQNKEPFEVSQGANRLSMYVYLPAGISNQRNLVGGDKFVSSVSTLAPFNGTGGHWYSTYYTQGGGWTHLIMDSHPTGNNSYAPPYPSKSYRDQGPDLFNKLYRNYFAVYPYEGIEKPKYYIWIDSIEFLNDPEPQNNETINTPSVMLHMKNNLFEIGFNDKYGAAGCNSTYQVKYSFSPITNVNWNIAKPVLIQATSNFNISANNTGTFKKFNSYRTPVWASFKIMEDDEPELKNTGKKLYFAIKDISNRDYSGSLFDGDYDNSLINVSGLGNVKRVNLIKCIDYVIPEKYIAPILHLRSN